MLILPEMQVAGVYTSYCESLIPSSLHCFYSKITAHFCPFLYSYNMLKKHMSPTGDPNYKFSSGTTLLYAAEASSQTYISATYSLTYSLHSRCCNSNSDQSHMGSQSPHVYDPSRHSDGLQKFMA